MALKEGFFRRVGWYWAGPAIQIVIGIGLLPLTTLKLDPADFGFFALITTAAAVMSALAGLGGGYVLTAHFQARDAEGRSRLNSSILAPQMIAALVLAIVLFVLLPLIVGDAMEPQLGAKRLYAMAAAGVFLTTSWGLAQTILVLEGRASTFTLLSLVNTIVAAAATLVALFLFDLDVSALFLGDFSSKIVLFGFSFVVLRQQLATRMEWTIIVEVLKLAPFSGTASAAQHFSQTIYRYLLNTHTNLTQLGLFVHAQSYERYAFTSIKAITYSIWPTSLAEAREHGRRFARTMVAWRIAQLAITGMGIGMALFGRDIIGILTHGKFVAAAPYAALLFVVLLAKHVGRADLAILYATSRGRTISNISLLSDVGGVLIAYVLVPHLTLYGIIIALFMREAIYRLGLMLITKEFQRIYSHDGWAILGSILVIAAVVFEESVQSPIYGRVVFILVLTAIIGALSWYEARTYMSPRIAAFTMSLRARTRL